MAKRVNRLVGKMTPARTHPSRRAGAGLVGAFVGKNLPNEGLAPRVESWKFGVCSFDVCLKDFDALVNTVKFVHPLIVALSPRAGTGAREAVGLLACWAYGVIDHRWPAGGGAGRVEDTRRSR